MNQRGRLHQMAERHELSIGMAAALLKLHDGASMRDLAERLHCDRSNVTGLIQRLERRRLVRRVADPHDGRSWQISLTPAGQKLCRAFRRDLETPPAAMKQLTKTEQRQLAGLLKRLVD